MCVLQMPAGVCGAARMILYVCGTETETQTETQSITTVFVFNVT